MGMYLGGATLSAIARVVEEFNLQAVLPIAHLIPEHGFLPHITRG